MKKDDSIKLEVVKTFISGLSLLVSVVALIVSFNSNYRNKQLMKPHFSVEKKTETNGDCVWLISNSGGMFYNSVIEPKVYLVFDCYFDDDFEYRIELSDYIKSVGYDSGVANGAFRIVAESDEFINEFVEKIETAAYPKGINITYGYTEWYINMQYNDYKERYNKHIFKIYNGMGLGDDASYENSIMDVLVETKELPKPDDSASKEYVDYMVKDILNNIIARGENNS